MSATKHRRTRPQLPLSNANPLLKTGLRFACYSYYTCSLILFALVEKDPVVKYQVIEREGHEIIVKDSDCKSFYGADHRFG